MNTGHPMKMNLYPYNMYILYAAAGILVVFLILTLKHLSSMGRTMKVLQDKSTELSEKAEILQDELQVRADRKAKSKFPVKKVLAGLLLLSAVKKDYDRHEEIGMRQAVRSAQNVYNARVLKKIITSSKTNIL